VAAELQNQLGIATELVVGSAGEFTVWADDAKVAEKVGGVFPEPSAIVAAVAARRA
jgi:hypothetical protein